jgi:hypothetical protein
MSKKPYIFEKKEWLEIVNRKDWNDSTLNPDDLAPYSELQRPYALPEGEDTYQGWEWTWPDIEFPDIPPIIIPDPIENPCSIDENCVWADIFGPDDMECGECFTWSQAHVYYGCEVAPWWAAYGAWTLEGGDGECYLLFSGPVMATVCCTDAAGNQTLELRYVGPLDCQGSQTIVVTCGVCPETAPTISGSNTMTTSDSISLTVADACTACTVSCTGDCTDVTVSKNGAGDTITVETGASSCGTIVVNLNCAGAAWSPVQHSIRVTDNGGWDTSTRAFYCTPSGDCAVPSKCGLAQGNEWCNDGVTCYQCDLGCVDVGGPGSPGGDCPDGDCYPPCSLPKCVSNCSSDSCCCRSSIVSPTTYTWTCSGTDTC